MRRSTRDLLGGFAILILCALAYTGLRYVLSRSDHPQSAALTQEERAKVERFEMARQQDSAREQAHWDSLHGVWDRQKAEREQAKAARELAHAERERAYADSQKVLAARKAEGAARRAYWEGKRKEWAKEKEQRVTAAKARQAHYDSLKATYPKKLPKGSIIEANAADTTLLKQIPGIGSVSAKRIVAYREALGGFINPRQIEEIEGLPYGIASWFRTETSAANAVHRINVNKADFKTLVRHPYLSYEQTKAIVNLRQRTGNLRSWNDMRGSGLFSDADFARLEPYFSF